MKRSDTIIVVGGGLVGLAVGQRLALSGREVVLIEKENRVAAHQSGHNSGVVHAGLYYTPGSLKARLCLEGRRLLFDYCQVKGITYDEVGKVVVATSSEQLARLDDIEARAHENKVADLRRIGLTELQELEPAASGLGALHSPHTAIVDFAAVANALAGDIADAGGQVRLAAQPTSIVETSSGVEIRLQSGELINGAKLIVCAGLGTDSVAALLGRPGAVRIVPFRGSYWRLVPTARQLVNGLIYPVPDPRYPFLGIHFTRVVGGDVLVGPNAALALGLEAYRRSIVGRDMLRLAQWPGFWRMAAQNWRTGLHEAMGSASRRHFTAGGRALVPGLDPADLEAGWAGIRAQAVDRRGHLLDDFVIDRSDHVTLVRNAPSPAATSSLAIARHIAAEI
ncbi:MAG: (S)-2-hydroxyglutarate dehydrogenase [Pseudonocardiales bacterium]|nr:(S)-2-hydroxyglutarate dehydrogenase [Pseudonocardiales bacterium]